MHCVAWYKGLELAFVDASVYFNRNTEIGWFLTLLPRKHSDKPLSCVDVVTEKDINLVDPASSHTLVSKIKPCMSKYKHFYTVKLRMAHYISYSLLDSTLLLG